jgi:hypothetical protein
MSSVDDLTALIKAKAAEVVALKAAKAAKEDIMPKVWGPPYEILHTHTCTHPLACSRFPLNFYLSRLTLYTRLTHTLHHAGD